jgi:hypothetical protein
MVAAMSLRTIESGRRGQSSPPPPLKQRRRKRPFIIAGVVVVALLVLVLVRSGTDKGKVSTTNGPTTTSPDSAALDVGPPTIAGADAGSAAAGQADTNGAANRAGATKIPLNVSVSNTKGLRDGDMVHIHVTPQQGSVVYGFEAFLCATGRLYTLDADIRPSVTGNCASQPLSAISQRYLMVKASPPFKVADGDFRVGTGSVTYQTQDKRAATVTCDRAHLCSIVLKLQFPNDFGFEAIPLTFR